MKLNLGCGPHLLEGYINIDQKRRKGVEYGNLTRLHNYEDNSVDEIYSAHVLQCFKSRTSVPFALTEWHRILKSGGTLIVEVPFMMPMINDYRTGKLPHDLFVQGMYGATGTGNLQTTCFDKPYLADFLTEAGFTDIKQIPQPKYSVHNLRTNLIMAAIKP